jgi:hypothetical protein
MSKRKRTSRNGRRKVRRNRYVLVNRAHGALRRLARNATIGGIDVMEKILFPALGATGGVLLAQWLGSKVGPSLMPGQDPKLLSLGASTVAAYGAYMLGEQLGLSPETQMTVAAGAGVAGLLPWIPPAMLPAGSGSASATTPLAPPANAMHGYYQRSMLSGLMVDVSHAGAPYKGMLGVDDPADPVNQDRALSHMEAVSTVEPMDLALPAISKRAVVPVTERMGTPRDRGWAGGTYGRSLFSGIMS